MDEIRFIAASGGLGARAIDEKYLDEALAHRPHFIAADAGTTDAGPFSLGKGEAAYSRAAVRRDLSTMLRAGLKANIPVLIGSAGTAGGDPHLDEVLDIARDICASEGWRVRTAVIRAEQAPDYLLGLYRSGRIRALEPAPDITERTFTHSSRIVGMMGVEPLQDALAGGAQLILAGRCSDPALYAAMPVAAGFPAGLAWHVGKAIECGTMVCETSGNGVILGRICQDHGIIQPIGKGLRCTPQSVAAHSLYENSDPYLHKECSGTLDLTHARFEAMEDGTSVRITGSAFLPADTYTVKLEGAELCGYQSIIIGGIRDPFIIADLDAWLAGVRERIEKSIGEVMAGKLGPDDYVLNFHVYGKGAVMGALEPQAGAIPHEVGIVFEATAPTQELATQIAKMSRQPLLHFPIEKWKGSITGFACLHNPAYLERGPVYRFNLNHVAVPDSYRDMFRTEHLILE
ncbi:DUF1446 domain-containing protein [Verticiella sediminum]|uniref:DUF1446 domain-containing protein n=1 Tax=Verticiella sediminum TaxID=1247510 RepID=A0A556AXF1_9BURK|nr:acyclic terpene utilization AtuA family protein [Verticiella sediminum]TSH97604.1 DUF1446 domain-containing protein [Verticiella sediminum]